MKLAEAFGCAGLRVSDPSQLDAAILKMMEIDGPVIVDVQVDPHENCFPMIPSGKGHQDMMLGDGRWYSETREPAPAPRNDKALEGQGLGR